MNDVIEYIIDGTSGLAPGGVDGKAIIAGVCSIGQVGKGYLIGKRTDLKSLLGSGPLVDRLRDALATGGQEPVLIAVPVQGMAGGYVGRVKVSGSGTGPEAEAIGVAAANMSVVVEIVDAGQLGTATCKVSTDGGSTFGNAGAVPANGQVAVAGSGTTLVIESGNCVKGDRYSYVTRTAIGPVQKVGAGADISITGVPSAAAEIVVQILKAGTRNNGTFKLSVDGGDNWLNERTVPADGAFPINDFGVTVNFPEGEYNVGATYSIRLLPPVNSISNVMSALEKPLELFDAEFVHVAGASSSPDWAAAGAKTDELWNAHRPTYFKMEARLPRADEDLNDWAASLIEERQGYAHRFVQVVASFAEVSDSMGLRQMRNMAGLNTGRTISNPVQRAAGRTRDGGISQATLPEDWNGTIQKLLEDNGFVTAKTYAGLESCYWGDSKTLAEVTSDYQYEEVLRTTFKAIRKARIAALKSMYDEAGDPVQEGGAAGLNYLQANIENALETMVDAIPKELAGHVVTIPPNQDVANNGVATEMELVGIPIIRKIKLFAKYTFAGGAFDPRLN
ncbi:MAG: DUF2586 domain-containing protein [Desulfovibrio sp.]